MRGAYLTARRTRFSGRSLWCLGVLLTGILVSSRDHAQAHDHEPPVVRLRQSRAVVQQGRLQSMCWTRVGSEPDEFVRECGQGRWAFPRVAAVDSRSRARFRMRKSQPPASLRIQLWRTVDGRGQPRGRGRELDFRLRPHVSRDSSRVLAHDAIFFVPGGPRDHYFRVTGDWIDEEGSGQIQDASWTFHVER